MEQNLKHRLVGVIVISSLAIIFLPMILDGSGMRRELHDVVIPAQPLVSANPEFEQKMIELKSDVESLPELEARYVDEQTVARESVETGDTDDTNRTGSVSRTPAEKVEAPQIETAAVTATSGGQSWVLQVGSFQDRDKALAQRDRIRRSNIAAVFIEQFQNEGKSSYRVRLGPFLNREQTQVAQNKIKAKHDIDGIIMKYER